jgi:hypothetical protein
MKSPHEASYFMLVCHYSCQVYVALFWPLFGARPHVERAVLRRQKGAFVTYGDK